MEIVRQKNVATVIVFPLVDADGDPVTSAGSLDSEVDVFADGTTPDGFADCTNEATEIGSTGQYYLQLTQTEMNNDYIIVQIKSTGAKTQVILIRTIVGDPLLLATTDDGGAINVAAGVVEAQVKGIDANAITATAINADAFTAAKFASDVSAEIADAVWDEDATGHQTQGTFGQAIGDPAADTNTIYKAVVTDATGATVGVDVAAVLVDTAEIGTAGAGLTNINLPNQTMDIVGNITGNLSGSVGSVTGLTASNLDATVSSRATPAQVNTEVLDVLNTDTFAEPSGVPAATITLATKISWLYMALRNKVTISSTKKTFFDDGDAAEWEKDLSDDGSTYTETEGNAI